MKLSKEQAARNRQHIVEVAGRLFRERGVDGVGVADLMKAAGFTHGGFYNHFPSKEALAAEACSSAFGKSVAAVQSALSADKDGPAAALSHYFNRYLSKSHRDDTGRGCPTASLAADAARQGEQVQAVFAEGLEAVLATFSAQLARTPPAGEPHSPASLRVHSLVLLSEIVGALVLARAVSAADPALSEEILQASRKRLCALKRAPLRAVARRRTPRQRVSA
jgi:TetR/AcrR family transcriptional repressor of nem operon